MALTEGEAIKHNKTTNFIGIMLYVEIDFIHIYNKINVNAIDHNY